jgi:hypothetical protein
MNFVLRGVQSSYFASGAGDGGSNPPESGNRFVV